MCESGRLWGGVWWGEGRRVGGTRVWLKLPLLTCQKVGKVGKEAYVLQISLTKIALIYLHSLE